MDLSQKETWKQTGGQETQVWFWLAGFAGLKGFKHSLLQFFPSFQINLMLLCTRVGLALASPPKPLSYPNFRHRKGKALKKKLDMSWYTVRNSAAPLEPCLLTP